MQFPRVGVAKCHLDLDVPVLDRGGDQAAWFADDEPGQGPAEPARGQAGIGGVGRDRVQPPVVTAVVADPRDQAGDVLAQVGLSSGPSDPASQGACVGSAVDQQRVREQQLGLVQPRGDCDGSGDRLDGDPGVVADLPFGQLAAVVAGSSLEVLAVQQDQPVHTVAGEAASFQVGGYW